MYKFNLSADQNLYRQAIYLTTFCEEKKSNVTNIIQSNVTNRYLKFYKNLYMYSISFNQEDLQRINFHFMNHKALHKHQNPWPRGDKFHTLSKGIFAHHCYTHNLSTDFFLKSLPNHATDMRIENVDVIVKTNNNENQKVNIYNIN